MKFQDISNLNIKTELDVLKRDTQPNSFFLYQHKGVFFADNNRIGNNDQTEAKSKFIKVITKAKGENISLLLSPEYSCPKSVIEEIIVNMALQPSQNKLWVLGGESLNKGELNNFRGIKHESVHIHFEDCYSNSDKNYVDPLYYIFKGEHDGIEKLIILIQFKTSHMGGLWSTQTEPNNLIEGNTIYVIKNDFNSVRLISFICSEAMNFNAIYEPELINNHSWTDSPFLILNIQFNPNPSHNNFIAFKQFALNREKRELITLNWGIKTTFLNGDQLYKENNAPRSGIYFKTSDTELDYKPAKIIDNHNKGLYFLQIKRNKRVYFLSRDVELFQINNKSVDIIEGVEEQQRREGPTVSNIYCFDSSQDLEEINNVPDNHIDFLNERGVINAYLLDSGKSIIDKERLLNISLGKVKGKDESKWLDVIHLHSFTLNESDECNNRLTYIEDSYQSSKNVRKNNCEYIYKLDEILLDKSNYPTSIEELKYKDILIAYPNSNSKDYRYNLTDSNGGLKKATICFVGSETTADANVIYNNIRKLFDPDSATIRRVVVFYTLGSKVEKIYDPKANSFTETPNDPRSIS